MKEARTKIFPISESVFGTTEYIEELAIIRATAIRLFHLKYGHCFIGRFTVHETYNRDNQVWDVWATCGEL
jgi:hypothetical protein